MSELQMREATEAEMRETVIAALKFSRKHAIRTGLLIAVNFGLAVYDQWMVAYDWAHHYRWLAVVMAIAAFVGVWSAGRLVPHFLRSFRMWQMHCLMLETLYTPPPADKP